MRLVNWLEVLGPANPSGVLEKLLQKFDTGPSESSESSTFQHFQRAQQHVIFLMCFVFRRTSYSFISICMDSFSSV